MDGKRLRHSVVKGVAPFNQDSELVSLGSQKRFEVVQRFHRTLNRLKVKSEIKDTF